MSIVVGEICGVEVEVCIIYCMWMIGVVYVVVMFIVFGCLVVFLV